MGRALGALEVLATLREALPNGEAIEAGSDGATWAAPSVAWGEAAAPCSAADAVATATAVLQGEGDTELATYLGAQSRRLLERCGRIDPSSLEDARSAGAYEGWSAAETLGAEGVLQVLKASGLRGRGGAYFPVHLKWRAAIEAAPRNGQPLLVVNAEEGEPGVFKDRVLMEGDPQRLVEGIRIAAFAIGAERAYLYINGQADLSAERMAEAIEAAAAGGLIGAEAGLEIEIRRGGGGYVCGEETVILESIEGQRAVPRLRPPFPTERGLWGRPTVINNVETLCNLPDVLRHGAAWFREVGSEDAPGTKLISLSGAFAKPGLIEVPLGTAVAEILEIGGAASDLEGIAIGGPSGGLLPPAKFDTPIAPGALDPAGAVLGAGGIQAFTAEFPVAAVVAVQASYNAHESCGKCTPCREGSGRLEEALQRLRAGDETARADIDELVALLRLASLCGLGQMAPGPVTSALEDFGAAIGPA